MDGSKLFGWSRSWPNRWSGMHICIKFCTDTLYLICNESKHINYETYHHILYSWSPVPLGLFVTDAIFGKNRTASDTAVLETVIMDHSMFAQKMAKLFVNAGIKSINKK